MTLDDATAAGWVVVEGGIEEENVDIVGLIGRGGGGTW